MENTTLDDLLGTIADIVKDQSVKNIAQHLEQLERLYLLHKLESAGLRVWLHVWDHRQGAYQQGELVVATSKKRAAAISHSTLGYFSENFSETTSICELRLVASEINPNMSSLYSLENNEWDLSRRWDEKELQKLEVANG